MPCAQRATCGPNPESASCLACARACACLRTFAPLELRALLCLNFLFSPAALRRADMSCRTPARLHACTPARLHACTPALLHCTHVLPHCKHVHCKHAVSHVPLHMIIIPLRVRSCVVVNSVPDHSFFVCGLGHMGLGTNTPSATWATAQIRNLCRMAHGTWPTPGAVPDHPEPETEEDGFRRGQSLQAGPFAPVPLLQCACRARAVRSGVSAAVWRPSSS